MSVVYCIAAVCADIAGALLLAYQLAELRQGKK